MFNALRNRTRRNIAIATVPPFTEVTVVGKATAHNKGNATGGVKVMISVWHGNVTTELGFAVQNLAVGATGTAQKSAVFVLGDVGNYIFSAKGYILNAAGNWEFFAQEEKTVEVSVVAGPAYDGLVVSLEV